MQVSIAAVGEVRVCVIPRQCSSMQQQCAPEQKKPKRIQTKYAIALQEASMSSISSMGSTRSLAPDSCPARPCDKAKKGPAASRPEASTGSGIALKPAKMCQPPPLPDPLHSVGSTGRCSLNEELS